MKGIIRRLVIFACALLCMSLTFDDCYNNVADLNKVLSRYHNDHSYYLMTSVTESNGRKNTPITAELWSFGEKVKFKTAFLTVLADDKTQVLISNTDNSVVIRPQVNGVITQQQPINIDSLKKYSSHIECGKSNGLNSLRIDYKKSFADKYKVERTVYVYNSKAQTLHSMITNFRDGQKSWTETVTYANLNDHLSRAPFSGSPESVIYSNGKIAAHYTGFRVNDLRPRN